MVQVLRLLRRLPVAQKVEDIAIFINRELLPFLQELRESTAASFEQITTNRLLGRDTPGTGDVEEISLDDTLEFTGSQVIQRAAITGDVTIPAGSNIATIPELAGILSDISDIQSDVNDIQDAEFITYASNAALTQERVATNSTSITVDLSTPSEAQFFRAALTGDVTAASNVNTTAFRTFDAKSVLVNATNASAVPDDLGSTVPRYVIRESDDGTSLEWGYPCFISSDISEGGELDFFHLYLTTTSDLIEPSITNLGDGIAGLEFAFGGTAAGDGLSLGPDGGFDVGAGDGINVNADTIEVDVTDIVDGVSIEEVATNNIQRAALTGAITALAGSNSTLFHTNASGAGLTGGGTSVLDVGAGTGITVNANDVAVNTAANFTWSGTHEFDNDATFDDVVDIGHLLLTTGVYTQLLLDGNNDNVAIGNVSVASFTTTLNPILTGMVPVSNGQLVWIENADNTESFSIAHDSTSTAANRFYCPHGQTLIISASTGVWARYNGTLSRWIIADSKEWKGLNVRDTPSLYTGVGTLDFIEGNGISLAHASSGTPPSVELDMTLSVNEASNFAWTGEHTYAESANGPTVSAGQGAFWPKNVSPTAPFFTDDVAADWPIGYACVSVNTTSPTATNATTNLSCGGSYTIPANTARAGTVYRIHGQYVYTHTAATTPTITFEILIGGSVVRSVALTPVASAATYTGWFTSTIRFQSIGAGGTCMATWIQNNDYESSVDNFTSSSHTGTESVDTTAGQAIEQRMRMTTAVASNTVTVVQGYIERLA